MLARRPLLLASLLVAVGGCVGMPTAPQACPGGSCVDASAGADRGGGGVAGDGAQPRRDSAGAVPGLVAAYGFNENGGTVAIDSSGNFLNAGLIGSVSWGTGRKGSGVSFGGGYVVMPPDVLAGATELTLAAWVRVRTDRYWQRIFDFGGSTNANLFLTTRSDALPNNTLRFAITRNGSGNEQRVEVSPLLPVGEWKHVAVVLGSAGGVLYVDGQEVARNTTLMLRPADVGEMPNDWIGRSQYSYDQPFDGDIDEVRIYTRALSDAEVMALVTGS